jgi:endonuclease/exonuclease/phosphatase family metal-dependent hydrolase
LFLDVLTINLWGLPWPLARDRRRRRRRFERHVIETAYDLIGIQELWWPWNRSLDVDSVVCPESNRDSGLALAGRLSATEPARIRHFRHRPGFDRLKRKGVLSSRIRCGHGLDVAVHVTHLQAGRGHGDVRTRQVDELLEVVCADDAPALVLGDFNFYAGNPEDCASDARLRSCGFEDTADAVDPQATYTSANRYVWRRRCAERFDRIFFRNGRGTRFRVLEVEALSELGAPVSDHHPVRARLDVDG